MSTHRYVCRIRVPCFIKKYPDAVFYFLWNIKKFIFIEKIKTNNFIHDIYRFYTLCWKFHISWKISGTDLHMETIKDFYSSCMKSSILIFICEIQRFHIRGKYSLQIFIYEIHKIQFFMQSLSCCYCCSSISFIPSIK